MNIEMVDINSIKINPSNPRIIKDDKYKKLIKSIKDFPEMLRIRPIVVDDEGFTLGGNMRLKACKELGIKEIPVIKASELNEKQKKEFIIKDNQSFGEWDTEMLAKWDKNILLDSGFELWNLIDIYGENEMTEGFKKTLEGSNFKPDLVDVNDYIKQNIIFLNEVMIEFEDDEVKCAIRNLKKISTMDSFQDELKKLIIRYGGNPA